MSREGLFHKSILTLQRPFLKAQGGFMEAFLAENLVRGVSIWGLLVSLDFPTGTSNGQLLHRVKQPAFNKIRYFEKKFWSGKQKFEKLEKYAEIVWHTFLNFRLTFAEQPKHQYKNEYCWNNAAAKFPRGCTC